MVNINLLDWRGHRVTVLNHRFSVILGGAIFITALCILSFDWVIAQYTKEQTDDIAYLTAQVTQIENKISEIKTLQEQKDTLLSRRTIIEKLQASRPFVVELFDDLSKSMPDGVVFDEMTRKDNNLSITGLSDSNYGVSVLMENLQRLRWVKEAKLAQITTEQQAPAPTDTTKNQNDNSEPSAKIRFQLSIDIQVPQTEDTNATVGN